MWSTTWMSRICANIFERMLIIWTRHQTPLWLCLTWIILLKEEQNYFLHTIYCACPNYAFGKSLISSSQNAKVLCHTMGLCSVNGRIRWGKCSRLVRNGSNEFLSAQNGGEKSWLPMYKSYHTIRVCEEITLKEFLVNMQWRRGLCSFELTTKTPTSLF